MPFQSELQKAIDHLKKEFTTLQVGRANAALVEDIEVESYGSMMPLKALANISCPDPKTIKIEPWDRSVLGEIERAVQAAKIGINPQNMGEHLYLPIPPMTEERRLQLVKLVHELAEKAKISVRNARQEAIKAIKAQKENDELSEDQLRDAEAEIQTAVDKANNDIDQTAKKKEEEVKTV